MCRTYISPDISQTLIRREGTIKRKKIEKISRPRGLHGATDVIFKLSQRT